MNRTVLKAADETRIIPGFSEYALSPTGQVWRVVRSNSLQHRKRPPPYLLRPKKSAKGYLSVSLKADDNRLKIMRVNRLIAITYHGPPPFEGAHAAHDDGNPTNNSPENIVWKTATENNRDRRRHGTMPHGEMHGRAKLKASDIPKIKRHLAHGRSQQFVAGIFGVSPSAIGRIASGRCWK